MNRILIRYEFENIWDFYIDSFMIQESSLYTEFVSILYIYNRKVKIF